MLRYAREDTHYLLYIYHVMRTELIRRGNDQQNLLRAVLDQSTRICLQVSGLLVQILENSTTKNMDF